MLSVIVPNVVMLNVVAPQYIAFMKKEGKERYAIKIAPKYKTLYVFKCCRNADEGCHFDKKTVDPYNKLLPIC